MQPMTSEVTLGLIADTHMPGSIPALWPEAIAFFEGCDAILHAGDLHTLEIVDTLSNLAPTYVALGNGDAGLDDPRLRETWTLDFTGLQVGMLHHCPSPLRKPESVVRKHLAARFTPLPNVVLFGHTHLESITKLGDLILVNPGSPTLPRNQSLQRGTLGKLTITPIGYTVALFQITESHVIAHPNIPPLFQPSTSLEISV